MFFFWAASSDSARFSMIPDAGPFDPCAADL